MNARQARRRRALLHPHWFASTNPADRTEDDRIEDSTNNLSQTDDPMSPPPKGYPQDALFAGNAVVPSEYHERGISPEPSPVNTVEPERGTSPQQSAPRCQFSFSDGRHCRMPRGEHDPRFCLHHTANNVKAKKARKRSRANQAIVELETFSGKFTTATDLNYALSQVFRSLAQDRIRPRNAAALGYLGQLLLQTLPGVKSEFSSTFGYRAWDESVKAMLNRPSDPCQPSHNEHLRTIHPHLSHNEHLRKP